MSKRYAIQHIPSKYYILDDRWKAFLEGREDFGSAFLTKEPELIFNNEKQANDCLKSQTPESGVGKGFVLFEDDSNYPINEFKVVEI